MRRMTGIIRDRGFTLIELLVVISIIALLISILIPALGRARAMSKRTLCSTRLRTLGQGLVIYGNENGDVLVPGRLPRVDNYHWSVDIEGGRKYRPTFLAMMGSGVGLPAFDDPMPDRTRRDRFGEPGDMQNYSSEVYVCPEVPDWTDERNGSFGYNYQFLGNSRLKNNPISDKDFKNWPNSHLRVRSPGSCVAVADALGTAASYPRGARLDYDNNGRISEMMGNEGFNLDPPVVDPQRGEMADFEAGHRSAVHERHVGRANVLWVDGHVTPEDYKSLGYEVQPDGVVTFGTPRTASNRFWHIEAKNEPWIHP